MIRRICKECGKEFETTSSRRQFCYEPHYRTCVSCGKQFRVKNNSTTKTCSEECRRKSIADTSVTKPHLYTCKCTICGKEFQSTSPHAHYCKSLHQFTCKVCGKPFTVANPASLRSTCSEECRYKLSNETFMSNIDENMKHFRDGMISKYGVVNPNQVPEFQEKRKETCLKKYGKPSFTQTTEFKEKVMQTSREKYGKDWYMQTEEYKQKSSETLMKKYGVTNVSKSRYFLENRINDPKKVEQLLKFREDPESYIRTNYPDELPTLLQLSEACGIRDSSIGYIIDQHNLRHLIRGDYSRMEDEVFQFLCEYIDESQINRNTFKVITPYELDIYLPDYKLAIECDPTWTHNSTVSIFDDTPIKSDYHKMKTDMCEAHGVRLLHLFGYDWVNHKDTCKSIILNSLGLTSVRYHARKLSIREVSGKDAFDFLEANHRQGGVNCKVRLGLYNDTELVSLMTFSMMRDTIGTGKDDTSHCWELVRFCNKNYTTAVGGASKLLKYFIDKYHPEEIRSFSDRAHTVGSLYSTLGFSELRRSDPGYVWVNLKNDIAYSRYNAQKRNIKNFLQDDTIDLSKTEVQIMTEHGYVQVFDSGTITWQLIVNNRKEDIA